MSKQACCYCCTAMCLTVVSLAGGAAFVASHFEEPSIDLAGTTMSLTGSASRQRLSVSTTIDISNPNGWPLAGSITDTGVANNPLAVGVAGLPSSVLAATANLHVFSVDDHNRNELHVSKASLPNAVSIAGHSDTSFTVDFSANMAPGSRLFRRLLHDCGPDSARQTKLKIKVQDSAVSILSFKVDLPEEELGPIAVDCNFDLPQLPSSETFLVQVKQTPESILASDAAAFMQQPCRNMVVAEDRAQRQTSGEEL